MLTRKKVEIFYKYLFLLSFTLIAGAFGFLEIAGAGGRYRESIIPFLYCAA